MKAKPDSEAKSEAMADRIKADLPVNYRVDWQEFLDSFGEDIIAELVRENGGWNSKTTFVQVRAVVLRMIQAWEAGQSRLREKIQDML